MQYLSDKNIIKLNLTNTIHYETGRPGKQKSEVQDQMKSTSAGPSGQRSFDYEISIRVRSARYKTKGEIRMDELTHFDENGNARMVDVSGKDITLRTASATGMIQLCREAFEAVINKNVKKGDVLTVAQVAGIMGCKRTSDLIPMCHVLNLTNASLTFEPDAETCSIKAVCTVKTEGKTGVEMEALTGVSTALLTIYDMVKAIDRHMSIHDIHLVEKHGGRSGDFYNLPRNGGEDA